jgi:hypothetical protein
VKYQNPAAAGFFRIERPVLNLVAGRRLTSSRCSRLDWFHRCLMRARVLWLFSFCVARQMRARFRSR